MSMNSPRPPRPPRPGGGRPGTRAAGPPRSSGLQQGAGPAPGNSDFGDTRTVILSRKNMGMHQKKKGATQSPGSAAPAAPAAAPAPAPQLPKASVVDGTVSCVSCSGSFPILGDEYYGAVVECPDCAAEFIIPTKDEVMAAAPAPAPVAPAPVAPAPAPVAAAPAATPAPAAPGSAAKKKAPSPAAKKKAPGSAAKKKASAPAAGPSDTKASPKKKRTVKKVPPFVEAELEDEEDVYACEIGPSDGGGGVIALVMILLTAGAGIAPAFMADASNTVKMAIPGGVGVVLAIVAFVMLKGSGPKSLVLTNKRVFAKAGKWFAQSDVD